MIPRIYRRQVRGKLRKFPAVALTGPRQCGKTTLAQQLGGVYFDMETSGSEARLDAEWEGLVSGRRLIIIDEAQNAPDVFSRLRGTIDADRKRNGRFLLLGSVSPGLMENVSESLAGRLGLVRMTPFILPELKAGQMDDLWLRGGYPDGGILDPPMFPEWQDSYLEMLVTRDLPSWGLPAKPRQTMRLLAMLAAVHGLPLNASQIGSSMALDHKTVLSHCDFLEGAYLIRRLQPFSTNIKKRLVKRPRILWRDSGLMHALMGVADLNTLYRQPWLGQSWEGFVIEQTLDTLSAAGLRATPYFFRTSDGYELDLVLDWGTDRWAIEIKLTSNPSAAMIDRLNATADLIDASRRVLVCRIARRIETEKLLVASLPVWLKKLVE
jgi:predicted AAA+ superfamily ATPase